ncbi:MAG TPA: CaiB/BaiF CoA-transferase family protein [Variovorax sp.]|nr:CaiB/BaiF CoA-transferase family protein [Variovorax sp.]
MHTPTGPLAGLKVLEMAGMGPAPFAAMLLADMGADIITVAAPAGRASEMPLSFDKDPLWRGRTRIELDLKQPAAVARVLDLAAHADVLIEGFRPGVMERLGLGPEQLWARQPALVYGRMTGWGQQGPLAMAAGHDPNYLALTGALYSIGHPDRPPVPPLNLVGDFGGGALFLVTGVLAALLRVRGGGAGQVVDAAIVDGALALMGPTYSMRHAGLWPGGRGENLLDGGAPFGRAYETADGRHMVVAAIEPKFYAALLDGLGLDLMAVPARDDPRHWPELQRLFAGTFKSRSRDEWVRIFESRDACVSPVLDLLEAPRHPHLRARQSFVSVQGWPTPAPAPRFSKTPSETAPRRAEPLPAVLQAWGLPTAQIDAFNSTQTSGDPL